MSRLLCGLVVSLACLGACSRAPEPVADDLLTNLSREYAPYQACVVEALKDRQDFDGQLPALIVSSGMAGSLQDASRRYLGQWSDLASLDDEGRVDATRISLQALGQFGGGIGKGPERGTADDVRRQMSMVEVMQILAVATQSPCSPSDSLLSLMETAKNEHF